MSLSRQILGLVAICAVVVFLAVLGLVFAFATRLEFDIDGLFLLLTCLVIGGVFLLQLISLAKQEGWLDRGVPWLRKRASGEASASNPAPPSAEETKK